MLIIKTKEKIILGIMIVLFIVSAGMFYYHNIHTNIQADKSKVPVLVATKDIELGMKLTQNNIKWDKIDKKDMIPDYGINEEELTSMVVSSKIYENEIINKKRLGKKKDEKEDLHNTYTINLSPDFSSKIEAGDLIRVYVQSVDKEGNIENRLVFDKKEVLKVLEPQVKESVEGLKVEVTDKDAISYYNAKEAGKIIILKYKDVLSKSDYDIPMIDIKNGSTNAGKEKANKEETSKVEVNKEEKGQEKAKQ